MDGRMVPYLVPSFIAALLFALVFVFRHKEPIQRLIKLGRLAPVIVPRVFALTTFLAGAILLFSGATPDAAKRLRWLNDFMPLPIVEVSHFFASLAGASLLVLARGLQRRLDAAYHLTIALLGAGILFSLLKALDYEEAVILSLMLVAMLPSRKYFYRKASLIEERYTKGWIAAICLVVLGSILLGFLSYRDAPMGRELILRFTGYSEAPRFIRATLGVVFVLIIFAGARLMRPARPSPAHASESDLDAAATIIREHPEAASQLALLGDKSLMFNEKQSGFVMYGVAGRSWVSLGDPVAPDEEVEPLALEFIKHVDRHGGWPVFYKVSRQHLPTYLDFGLSVVKIGEEARVSLPDFSLEGSKRRNVRRVWRKAIEDGCSFEFVDVPGVPALLPELRAISDEWLEEKKAREKGFSLGFFDNEYVKRYPVALVRKESKIVAFANVWPSGRREELEVDLMRFSKDAPPGVMRYLLAETMLWGKDGGWKWFNMGMAPLSGLKTTSVTPVMNQLAGMLYSRGERFYNFQGVRNFKEWFYPMWEPRYLVSPGGALRPVIMANIATLIAGGLEGVMRK
ncbi:MAG: bifunctional lysylphosphatidylglycerol flippase/synthetase MprF [Gemmatimonadota bacterium]|nr:bifunctional lysylphosphatidylglycerol flippase/synthetase MprF [Gemmatimonadota bacterium]